MSILRGGCILEDIPEKIQLIGIGAFGRKAINEIASMDYVESVHIDTDADELIKSFAAIKIHLEKNVGDLDKILDLLVDTQLAVIVSSMDDSSGASFAPVVASLAQERGALAVAVAVVPNAYEEMQSVSENIMRLKESANATIVIDCDDLDSTKWAVKGITDLLTKDNFVAMDYYDMKAILSKMGLAIIGIGSAIGENRYLEAVQKALSKPQIKEAAEKAELAVVKINTGDRDGLRDVFEPTDFFLQALNENCNTLFAAIIEEVLGDKVYATIIVNQEVKKVEE